MENLWKKLDGVMEKSELVKVIMAEMKNYGMKANAIDDLTQLAEKMLKLLSRVPDMSTKLGLASDTDLLHNIQVQFFMQTYLIVLNHNFAAVFIGSS